jgi:hypothetical protein
MDVGYSEKILALVACCCEFLELPGSGVSVTKTAPVARIAWVVLSGCEDY